ncbi:GNAT family N-acetyltransferase [Salinarimonas sp.]|uniref:GNAT family N-acetyltransferase n=1 Tax=Salinarimonas sp. TaxID=2766526 RepID=UPI0032D9AC5D
MSDLPGSLWSALACDTERLVLRPLAPADAPALAALTNHPAVAPAISFLPFPFGEDDARALVARNAPDACERFLGIFHEGTLVGVIGAHAHPSRGGAPVVEIGYWLGADARGRGHAREAASGLIARLRALAPEAAILAEVHPDNHASARLLRALGFVETGEPGARPGRRVMALPPR